MESWWNDEIKATPEQEAKLLLLGVKLLWHATMRKYSVTTGMAYLFDRPCSQYSYTPPDRKLFSSIDEAIKETAEKINDPDYWY